MTVRAITSDACQRIEGAFVRDLTEIALANGTLVEFFRPEWLTPGIAKIEHVFQRVYAPGAISAWHKHETRTDFLFLSGESITAVLFDARPHSTTRGQVAEYNFDGSARLLIIPPGLWHGFHNKGTAASIVIGMFDFAYDPQNPDEVKMPPDSPQIPYRFDGAKPSGS